MKKPRLNVKLLKKIVKHIKANPKDYSQNWWCTGNVEELKPKGIVCDTAACIGGWAVLLSVPKEEVPYLVEHKESIDFYARAKKLLGLTSQEAAALFSDDNQIHATGIKGAREGIQKINDLIRDRKSFPKKHQDIY